MIAQVGSKKVIAGLGALILTIVIFWSGVPSKVERPSFIPSTTKSSDHRGHKTLLIDDVFNTTLGFEAIFVVGLKARSDRRDGMFLQAGLSNIKIEFIDGVRGQDVPDKAVPITPSHGRLANPSIGSWRAHMNAVQEIVKRNLTSALILEDDVDWDIRLKQQLKNFALSSQALIQPLEDAPDLYADATYPEPPEGAPSALPDILFEDLPRTIPAKVSPYGDGWDAIWLGHCGMSFPFETSKLLPKGRVIHRNDVTVAPKRHLWSLNTPFILTDKYPDHTSSVHHAQEGICTLGYALTQKGARALLHEVALKDVSDAYDFLLRFYCDGERGRRKHNCLSIQPSLFNHHRPAGPNSAASDIGDHGDGFKETSSTDMVRWSVRLNVNKLLDGDTDYIDQFPDEVPPPPPPPPPPASSLAGKE